MWCIQLSDSRLLMVQSSSRLSAPEYSRLACEMHEAKIKCFEHIELVLSERYPLIKCPLAGAFTCHNKAQLRSFVVLITWLFELMLSWCLSSRHYNSLGECAPSSFAIEDLPAHVSFPAWPDFLQLWPTAGSTSQQSEWERNKDKLTVPWHSTAAGTWMDRRY